MRNKLRKSLCTLLCLSVLGALLLPAFAAEPGKSRTETETAPAVTVTLSTEEEFLEFAENCRLDSYSAGMLAVLEEDLNLDGLDFQGIPIFCGTFDGNGHTIRGVYLTPEGSDRGLFRYLTETARVQDLRVEGSVSPEGTRSTVGGIAGVNLGTIRGCAFSGTASGSIRVGGIAGSNGISGVIEDCETVGTVSGAHFIGGIAGENLGVIRRCVSTAAVNTTEYQNTVEISDITIDALTNAEAAQAVTDIGGIAGTSRGVIRACENRGDVGYRHMGYNVGGIAGSHSGYLADCRNSGAVCGRKEVGGLVGQAEPVTRIDFSRDALQILQGQMAATSGLIHKTAADARDHAATVQVQVETLRRQAQTAADALEKLLPNAEHPELPDEDSLHAAQNALSSTMTAMQGTMNQIAGSTREATEDLGENMKAVAGQMSMIGSTVGSAASNLGANFTDVSDGDTPDNHIGKAEGSVNTGAVLGDLNVGGLVGAIAWENDLDPEDDLSFSGQRSLNFEGEIRAVVTNCRNEAAITAKKRNAGGIVGRMSFGLVKNCVNIGTVDAGEASYVGGIAGTGTGFIRDCSSKCTVSGKLNVGGIAGSASEVSGCRSMVWFLGEAENLGAILGSTEPGRSETEQPIRENVYAASDTDVGAIDGVSFAGQAEPLPLEEFLALPELDDAFRTVKVTFRDENGVTAQKTIPVGGAVTDIPPVPQREGYTGAWKDLDQTDLEHVYFDMSFEAVYTGHHISIRTEQIREPGKPILLAEGVFSQTDRIEITRLEENPALPGGQKAAEVWSLPVFYEDQPVRLRFAAPEKERSQIHRIWIRDAGGLWREAECEQEASYLIFQAQPGDDAFCLVVKTSYRWLLPYVLGGAAAVGLVILVIACRKRRKKRNDPKV